MNKILATRTLLIDPLSVNSHNAGVMSIHSNAGEPRPLGPSGAAATPMSDVDPFERGGTASWLPLCMATSAIVMMNCYGDESTPRFDYAPGPSDEMIGSSSQRSCSRGVGKLG